MLDLWGKSFFHIWNFWDYRMPLISSDAKLAQIFNILSYFQRVPSCGEFPILWKISHFKCRSGSFLRTEKQMYPTICEYIIHHKLLYDVYMGIYRVGYIFVYTCASVPWIISVNKFRFFLQIWIFITHKLHQMVDNKSKTSLIRHIQKTYITHED